MAADGGRPPTVRPSSDAPLRITANMCDFLLVACVDTIDEVAIPIALDREIGAEAALDERIDHVRKREKDVERKPLDQQRQDVLRTDSLETILRAVPILERVELKEALLIVSIRRRQLLPIFVDDEERFGPAHVAVAPDHVGNDESAVR